MTVDVLKKIGAEDLGEPQYMAKPYIVTTRSDMVVTAGTIEEIMAVVGCTDYYDNCLIKVREHDLYLNDNTKLGKRVYCSDLWMNDAVVIKGHRCTVTKVFGSMIEYKSLADGHIGKCNPKSIVVKEDLS